MKPRGSPYAKIFCLEILMIDKNIKNKHRKVLKTQNMAHPEGLEPTISAVGVLRLIQLGHGCKMSNVRQSHCVLSETRVLYHKKNDFTRENVHEKGQIMILAKNLSVHG